MDMEPANIADKAIQNLEAFLGNKPLKSEKNKELEKYPTTANVRKQQTEGNVRSISLGVAGSALVGLGVAGSIVFSPLILLGGGIGFVLGKGIKELGKLIPSESINRLTHNADRLGAFSGATLGSFLYTGIIIIGLKMLQHSKKLQTTVAPGLSDKKISKLLQPEGKGVDFYRRTGIDQNDDITTPIITKERKIEVFTEETNIELPKLGTLGVYEEEGTFEEMEKLIVLPSISLDDVSLSKDEMKKILDDKYQDKFPLKKNEIVKKPQEKILSNLEEDKILDLAFDQIEQKKKKKGFKKITSKIDKLERNIITPLKVHKLLDEMLLPDEILDVDKQEKQVVSNPPETKENLTDDGIAEISPSFEDQIQEMQKDLEVDGPGESLDDWDSVQAKLLSKAPSEDLGIADDLTSSDVLSDIAPTFEDQILEMQKDLEVDDHEEGLDD